MIVLLWPVLTLTSFHAMLVWKNENTNEHVRRTIAPHSTNLIPPLSLCADLLHLYDGAAE